MSKKKIKRTIRAFTKGRSETAETAAVPAEVEIEMAEAATVSAEVETETETETEAVEVATVPAEAEPETAEGSAEAEPATEETATEETAEVSEDETETKKSAIASVEAGIETAETETVETAQALAADEVKKAEKIAARKAKKAEKKQAKKEKRAEKKQAKKEKKARRRPNLFIPFIFGITIAFTFGCGTLCKLILENSANFLFTTTEDIVLADFVGLTADEVTISSQYSQLDIVYEEEYNSDIAEGLVYKQSPVDGRTVKEGQTVTLTVSLGTKYVTIPDYTGLTQSEAQEALLAEGVYVQVLKNVDSSVDIGSVIRTEPAAGQMVEAGSTVYLYVSMAQVQTTTTMPNIVGLTLEDAKTVLTRYKITTGNISYDFSVEYPVDVIMAQAVTPGSSIAINGRAAITVSLGPGPVEGYVYIDPSTISASGTDTSTAITALGTATPTVEAIIKAAYATAAAITTTQP